MSMEELSYEELADILESIFNDEGENEKEMERNNKKEEFFDTSVFNGLSHKPMVIYGRIYSDCTVIKIEKDNITVLVNDLEDDWLDKSIIKASNKTFTLYIKEYGNYPGNNVKIDNYFNFWMPLDEFMTAGIKSVSSDDKFVKTDDTIKMAKRLWKIAGQSPESGNAIMDLLGEKIYDRVMNLAKEVNTKIDKNFPVNRIIDYDKYDKYDNKNNYDKSLAKKVNVKKIKCSDKEKQAEQIYLNTFKNTVVRLNIPDSIKRIIDFCEEDHNPDWKTIKNFSTVYYLFDNGHFLNEVYYAGFNSKKSILRFVNKSNTKAYMIKLTDISTGRYSIHEKENIKKQPVEKENNTKVANNVEDLLKTFEELLENGNSGAIYYNNSDLDFDDIISILKKKFGSIIED